MPWHPLSDCLDRSTVPPDPQRRALEWVRRAWDSLAGALPPAAAVPRSLSRRGVLTIAVADEALASRVRAERAEILKRLQAFLGPGVVTGLRWETGGGAPPAAAAERPPVPLPKEAQGAAGAISDPSLRERFMAACRALSGAAGPARG